MTIDSNIIIALLDKEDSVVMEISRFQEMGFTFFLPTVTESEVLSYSKWTDAERRSLPETSKISKTYKDFVFSRCSGFLLDKLYKLLTQTPWQT